MHSSTHPSVWMGMFAGVKMGKGVDPSGHVPIGFARTVGLVQTKSADLDLFWAPKRSCEKKSYALTITEVYWFVQQGSGSSKGHVCWVRHGY